jgi:putative transcriptional regulator
MKSLKGHFLIASPKLFDVNFYHTVVLMVQHDEAGALGLIVNRPLETRIENVWDQVSESECAADEPLHQGGPCEGPLMAVHTDETLQQMEILPGLYFSTEKEAVEQLVTSNACPMKFFVGYAGWTAGQLEREMEEGGWMVAEASGDAALSHDGDLWERLVRQISEAVMLEGVNPKCIPEDPSMN